MRVLILALWLIPIVFHAPGQPAATTTNTPGEAVSHVTSFDALCKALRENYPMLEFAGWQDAWENQFRGRIEGAPSSEAAFELMDELVCRLNDYHTRLLYPGKPRLASAACRVEPVFTGIATPSNYGIWAELRPAPEMPALQGVSLAVVETGTNDVLRVGDEIVTVDGTPVLQALAAAWKHSVGCSTAGKLRSAAWRLLAGPPGRELELAVRRNGKEQTVKLPRSGEVKEPTISQRQIEGVAIIRITRWGGEDLVRRFDEMLSELRDSPGIIIDVRGNGGGQDGLANQVTGRFISRPVISSISFHRKVPGLTFERTVDYTEPRGPWRYQGRVAILIDEGCMSACEHFVSGMIEAGALACGTPTSGACGWIRTVELPEGLRLNVSQTFPLHTAGIPSPMLGIAPHIWAPRMLAELRLGKDTALTAALTWLKSREAVPARLQPMAPFSR
jgi:carboxyl-terminal processing protease